METFLLFTGTLPRVESDMKRCKERKNVLPRVSQKSILEAKKKKDFEFVASTIAITICDSFAGGNSYVTRITFSFSSASCSPFRSFFSLRVDYKFKLHSRRGSNSVLRLEIVCVLYSRGFLADFRIFLGIGRRKLLLRCRLKTKTSSARFFL